ncbi:ThiF family adenylyltransferase [Pacificispira sp.]|uniref:ThiF family adenylyltransferase n=1 Tax=Pacificispira sp. TaxID=2888761 RepID=UPI003B5165CA
MTQVQKLSRNQVGAGLDKVGRNPRFNLSLEKLEEYLGTLGADVERLSDDQLTSLYPSQACGWSVPLECGGNVYHLHYLIDHDFPYSLPSVVLCDYEDGAKWPHRFEGNQLCLYDNRVEIDPTAPVSVFKCLIKEAHDLIVQCENGDLDDDFDEEFLSYWRHEVTDPDVKVFSLLTPNGPTRHINLLGTDECFVACESANEGNAWLCNFLGGKARKARLSKGVFVWLGRPPKLRDFTRTNSSFFELVKDLDASAKKVLTKALKGDQCYVIFGFDTGNGTALASLKLFPAKAKSKKGSGKHERLAAQLRETSQTKLFNVKRVDAGWCHGRDQDSRSLVLSQKKVVMIGCGSVGSSVATKLAEAGVGTLELIDADILAWENISRHELGADDVGLNKASALASRFRGRFPHHTFQDHPSRWQRAYETKPSVLSEADLIISTTGSWMAEAQLNELALQSSSFPPILYGWTEPHAVAGHAVLITCTDACFACQLSNVGRPKLTVSSWPAESQTKQEPACGTFFQPYGPVELSAVNTMIAATALDALLLPELTTTRTTWIGSAKHLGAVGGRWNQDWISEHGDPKNGSMVVKSGWLPNKECKYCGGQP